MQPLLKILQCHQGTEADFGSNIGGPSRLDAPSSDESISPPEKDTLISDMDSMSPSVGATSDEDDSNSETSISFSDEDMFSGSENPPQGSSENSADEENEDDDDLLDMDIDKHGVNMIVL